MKKIVATDSPSAHRAALGVSPSLRSDSTSPADSRQERPNRWPATAVTKSMLGYGVVVGPLYVLVVLAQALVRPGFDLSHDDASLLSNGDFGWIQVVNFMICGLMIIVCAVGVRRALHAGRGATWGPILLGLFGVGLIAAGILVADPMNGFPPGSPAGHPATITVHGTLHIVSAGIGFFSLIAACFVLARRLSMDGSPQLAIASRATGVIFLAGFVGVASGSSSPAVVAAFWFALLAAWTWLATVAVHLHRRTAF